MTSPLVEAPEGYIDNHIWIGWQRAKDTTLRESYKKENSREHWRAMIEEAKAECAWMLEATNVHNENRFHRLEASIKKYREAGLQLSECVEVLIKLINRSDRFSYEQQPPSMGAPPAQKMPEEEGISHVGGGRAGSGGNPASV